MEALVRWDHPVHGFISPSVFIPIAERSGFVVEIGRFVFEEVCKTISSWKERNIYDSAVCINLSRVELYQADLINFMSRCIKKYNISPNQIDIELTETAGINDIEYIKTIITQLKEVGFLVAMDDFGTGYSSLSCLKSIPFDVLKLDRSFLNGMEDDFRSANVISSVIKLAKSLNFMVVAEGVETKEQSDFLSNMGCDVAQGFFYAKPMPKQDIEAMLLKNQSLAVDNPNDLKTTKTRTSNAVEYVKNFFHDYLHSRDYYNIISYFSNDITWIGTGAEEMCASYKQACELIRNELLKYPDYCTIQSMDLKEVWIKNDISLVTGTFSVEMNLDDYSLEFLNARTSAICEGKNDDMRITHFHVSIPNVSQDENDFFPQKDIMVLKELLDNEKEGIAPDQLKSFKNIYNKLIHMTLNLEQKNKILNSLVKSDGLTNLYNHKHITSFVDDGINEFKSSGKPLSVLMMDLDDYKSINDNFGHPAGDQVLLEVSNIIKTCIGENGFAGRYGGDEFLIVLPNIPLEEAKKFAHEICYIIQEAEFTEYKLKISTSIGVAEAVEDMTAANLIKLADEKLYKAKANGKRTVVS